MDMRETPGQLAARADGDVDNATPRHDAAGIRMPVGNKASHRSVSSGVESHAALLWRQRPMDDPRRNTTILPGGESIRLAVARMRVQAPAACDSRKCGPCSTRKKIARIRMRVTQLVVFDALIIWRLTTCCPASVLFGATDGMDANHESLSQSHGTLAPARSAVRQGKTVNNFSNQSPPSCVATRTSTLRPGVGKQRNSVSCGRRRILDHEFSCCGDITSECASGCKLTRHAKVVNVPAERKSCRGACGHPQLADPNIGGRRSA